MDTFRPTTKTNKHYLILSPLIFSQLISPNSSQAGGIYIAPDANFECIYGKGGQVCHYGGSEGSSNPEGTQSTDSSCEDESTTTIPEIMTATEL